jgi:hypothetical protein
MTEQEYEAYRQPSVPAYAADLERARGKRPEVALDESDKAFAKPLAEAEAPERTWALRVLTSEAGLRQIALNGFGWNRRAEALYRSLGYVTGWMHLSKPLQEQP